MALANGPVGFVLTFDGFSLALSTMDVATLPTSTDTDWDTHWTLAQGYLVRPRVRWTERLQLLDGDLQTDSLRFEIYDKTWTGSGPAQNSPLISWYGTQQASRYVNTTLDIRTAGIDFLDTSGTFTLTSATGFSSGVIWIDQEAINGTLSGSIFTPTTRGYYGSRAVFHLTDAANSYSPAVYASFPTFEGRRCILWAVDSANVATPIWRGYNGRGPRFGGSSGHDRGATFEFQCEPAWNIAKEARVGLPTTPVTFRGYSQHGISMEVSTNAYPSSLMNWGSHDIVHQTADEAMATVAEALQSNINTTIPGTNASCFARNDGDTATLWLQASFGQAFTLHLHWGSIGDAQSTTSQTADPRSTFVSVSPLPPYALAYSVSGGVLPVTSTRGFPTAPWTPSTQVYNGLTTMEEQVLIGKLSDSVDAIVTNVSAVTANDTSNAGGQGPSITGVLQFRNHNGSRAPYPGTFYYGSELATVLTVPVDLVLASRITSDHWFLALRYGVVEDAGEITAAGIDSRDFDWTNQDLILDQAGGSAHHQTLYVRGDQTFSDIALSLFKMHGIGPGIRGSRISPVLLAPPLPTSTIALTLAVVDSQDVPLWQRIDDGIVNSVEIDSPYFKGIVNDQSSIARFGQQRLVALKLGGSDTLSGAGEDTVAMATGVLQRMVSIWGEPNYSAKLTLTLAHFSDVYIGDYVKITDWLIPDLAGNRAPTSLVGQCIGREIDLDQGTVTLEVLFYDFARLAGYAPSLRVHAIANSGPGGVGVIVADTGYLVSIATDYAGSNLSSYTGTANDGGASGWTAGDLIEFVSFDSTTNTTDGPYTVASVSGTSITLTAPIAAGTITYVGTPGNKMDCIYPAYGNGSTITAQMKKYGWVASHSTNVIGTSTDTPNNWGP